MELNIRISKLYQGAPWGALEVAFDAGPEGDRMMAEIVEATGLPFSRPPANLLALRELHIAEVGGEDKLEAAYVLALGVAARHGEVQDSQKNMKGPGELTANELGKALDDQARGI